MNAAFMTPCVLVVDDNVAVRRSLGRSLRGRFEVLLAASADEALLVLEARAVDLVVSDHCMPGRNGLELLELIRERYPAVRRVMCSSLLPEGAGRVAELVLTKPMQAGWVEQLAHLVGSGGA
jgi:CheY-like chemotaxis protein